MLAVSFAGGPHGPWRVERIDSFLGEPLERVNCLSMLEGDANPPPDAVWVLRGVTSNERYATRVEHETLLSLQQPLGRAEATRAALIPVRKSAAWWSLSQDERRAIFEERSRHISTGLKYLPAVARRLHHCRELGGPFDFLTWFEYPWSAAAAFEELVGRLRATDEWRYVEREVDIRLSRRG